MSLGRIVRGVLVGLLALYAAIALVARATYRSILYPVPAEGALPVPAGAELLSLVAADGVAVRALHFAANAGSPTIVHFHGNGETIGDNVDLARALASRGLGVVLVEYRGYGVSRSAGRPTEDGLYLDATATLDALERRGASRDNVVLWGTSLGTGVAAEMARRGRGRALILVSPYTSIPALAARIAPFLPVRLIVGDHYDNRSKASEIHVPTLVIHGERDEVIPFAMGEAIAGAIAGARFVPVARAHHNDLFVHDGAHLLDEMARHAGAR